MRERAPRSSSPRRLGVIGHALRWQPCSYLQVWALTGLGAVICALTWPVLVGWPPKASVAVVTPAIAWFGFGLTQSYYLHRRRTS
jgi:hypothetical protein